MDILENFRNQIDTIDEEIIYLLSRRFEIVKQIWKIKKENNITPLQIDRWQKVINNLIEEAKDKWINEKLVIKLWEEIHKESLILENNTLK